MWLTTRGKVIEACRKPFRVLKIQTWKGPQCVHVATVFCFKFLFKGNHLVYCKLDRKKCPCAVLTLPLNITGTTQLVYFCGPGIFLRCWPVFCVNNVFGYNKFLLIKWRAPFSTQYRKRFVSNSLGSHIVYEHIRALKLHFPVDFHYFVTSIHYSWSENWNIQYFHFTRGSNLLKNVI